MQADLPTKKGAPHANAWKRWLPWIGIGLMLLGAFVLLLFIDPTKVPFFPQCIFRKLTGWYCPGCGTARGVYQLVHGNIVQAWYFNPALIIGLLLLTMMFFSELLGARYAFWCRLSRFFSSSLFAYLLLAAIILWWILRNIL